MMDDPDQIILAELTKLSLHILALKPLLRHYPQIGETYVEILENIETMKTQIKQSETE